MDDELLEFRAEFCTEAAESLASAESALRQAVAYPAVRAKSIEDAFRHLHSIKGVAAALDLELIRDLAHEAESLLSALKEHGSEVELEGTGPLFEAISLLGDIVSAVSDGEESLPYARPVSQAIKALRTVPAGPHEAELECRLSVIGRALTAAREGQADPDLVEAALEAVAALRSDEALADEVESLPRAASEPEPADVSEPADDGVAKPAREFVRIELHRIERVFNLVGELLAKVEQNSESDAHDPMQRLATELHGAALGLRLVPMAPTFRRLRRVVHDTARQLGREIELRMDGMETEVGRRLARGITDPLVHIVRNAIDHGIEPPAVRLAAGKPSAGRLTISAKQKAGEVEVAIEDDGQGIDHLEMLRAAKLKGIVPQNRELDRAECFRLLFASGLSTAHKVSEVSGRGIGMDVVRRNVEAMRGTIDVESEVGRGSRFTIRLPLSLASMDAMFFRVAGGVFAVPMHSVYGVIRMKDHTEVTAHGRPTSLRVRDTLYPLIHVHAAHTRATSGLIIEDRDRRAVLPVDHVLGPGSTLVKSLGEYLGSVPRIAGCTVMKSGEIALLLDPRPMMEAVFGLPALTG